jgi:hypothetical protein
VVAADHGLISRTTFDGEPPRLTWPVDNRGGWWFPSRLPPLEAEATTAVIETIEAKAAMGALST